MSYANAQARHKSPRNKRCSRVWNRRYQTMLRSEQSSADQQKDTRQTPLQVQRNTPCKNVLNSIHSPMRPHPTVKRKQGLCPARPTKILSPPRATTATAIMTQITTTATTTKITARMTPTPTTTTTRRQQQQRRSRRPQQPQQPQQQPQQRPQQHQQRRQPQRRPRRPR